MNSAPQIIAAMLAWGMAVAFVLADRDSPTSRALSVFLFSIGVSIFVISQFDMPMRAAGPVPWWGGVFALPEVLSFYFGHEWILRVRRTIPAGGLQTRFADNQLRVGQALAFVYGVLALLFPATRADQFMGAALNGAGLGAGFALFAVPLGLSLLLGIGGGLITLNRRPDLAERQRLIAFALGAPFMASGLVLPAEIGAVLTSLGLLIFLVGGVQYHVIQGRRAQFMSRFLAPQVAELVRNTGLRSATRHQTLEISVVCCDLRGFTAVSVATDSKQVISVLRDYYEMVGNAVARAGGTIKDQAGDGVLVLVGAPIWSADHAGRAIELAQQIRQGAGQLTRRWSQLDLRLGVGVGVATGFVTVGVIGAASRLEYTAVGSAVNLASRLCSEAVHAEVLVDKRTSELVASPAGPVQLQARAPLALKGFSQPVPHFALNR
jgi:adenylate cyclase